MTNRVNNSDVPKVKLFTRLLKIEPASVAAISLAIADINKAYGVDHIVFDKKTQVLTVSYDSSRIEIDSIENVLIKHDVSVNHDWWTF